MLSRTTLISLAIAAIAGAIVLANSLVRVRVDETLVVYTAQDPLVLASGETFFGWRLRKPFSDYALVTQRVLQIKYDQLDVVSEDDRPCQLRNLAIIYRFDNPVVAANAERSQRNRHRISASRTFEGRYGVGLVGELENLTSDQIRSTLQARRLPESPALTRAAAAYGATVQTVTDAPEVVCESAATLQPLQ